MIKFWELCSPKQIHPNEQKDILRKDTARIYWNTQKNKKVKLHLQKMFLFIKYHSEVMKNVFHAHFTYYMQQCISWNMTDLLNKYTK